MSYEITLEIAHPLMLAAIRVHVPAGGVATAWKPALDKVLAFLRANHESHKSYPVNWRGRSALRCQFCQTGQKSASKKCDALDPFQRFGLLEPRFWPVTVRLGE